MKNILADLTNWKEQIDEAKSKKSELEGSSKEILKQLKKNHGVSSIEDAQKKIVKLSKESEKLQKLIEKEYEELKEIMEELE